MLIPGEFEFWQGNDIRLHDRLRFRKALEKEELNMDMITLGENGWIIERLAPWFSQLKKNENFNISFVFYFRI